MKDELTLWLYKQIRYDEKLYPFTSRSWEYESNGKRRELRIVMHPRQWRGRDAWWRIALHRLKQDFLWWTRPEWEQKLFETVMKRRRWPGLQMILVVVKMSWHDHIENPDAIVGGDPIIWGERALHVAEWDPERTDLESKLKRELLAAHVATDGPLVDGNASSPQCTTCQKPWPCRQVRRLANVYQLREGFRPDWGLPPWNRPFDDWINEQERVSK